MLNHLFLFTHLPLVIAYLIVYSNTNLFKKIIELSDHLEQLDKRRVVVEPVTKPDTPKKEELTKEPESTKIILKILSIQKDSLKEQIPFTATDKNGLLCEGTIDRAIVRDEITANTIVEYDCKTLEDNLKQKLKT